MKEIFLLLLTIIIIFIVSKVIAAYLANFIIFSDSDEEKEEKKHITHDIFFVCVKRNMNASYEAGYDSFGFESQEDAEAYKKDLIQDGIPEEKIKIEIRRN